MKRIALFCVAAALAACGTGGGSGAPVEINSQANLSVGVDGLALPGGPSLHVLDKRLRTARGPVEVWVSLSDASVAAQQSAAQGLGAGKLSRRQVQMQVQGVNAVQDSLMGQLAASGAQELARVTKAHNAIAIRVDASQLAAIAKLTGVAAVRPVVNYDMALSETVPYIGAAAAQRAGKDGAGVRVAVIDSGIDYTHRNLGGAGTAEAYAAAYGAAPGDPLQTTLDGLFPTDKVVGGYDFVGDAWPVNGPRSEDPDPIDFQGHGTHVADIAAGRSADGQHVGVAPGAKLYAIKVCSSVASSCNGISLLKAMDFAMDPNDDGDTSDAVDVINMSLGSNYGQQEDDLTEAAATASAAGVVVVTAAGNAADRPYIVSSPSIGKGVLSVAQTQVPSAVAIPLIVNSPPGIAGTYGNTATVDWAPVGSGASGSVAYIGRGCPAAGANPADTYLADPSGKVALIDRGACAVSLKVDRAAKAGASAVIIGLVASGDAVSFSYGGGDTFVPTIVIQQSLSNAIKANIAAPVNVSFSLSSAIPLVGSMASTSARGPSMSTSAIKPEIGAPGASVSAVAGTGTEAEAFGGTSGATPMVAGSAAILRQAFPNESSLEIRSRLMNSAEIRVFTNPATVPGELAPITRIGAGEVRVDRALALHAVAYDKRASTAALSFGFTSVSDRQTFEKTLTLKGLSGGERRYTVTASFRYANDAASGAVSLQLPGSVSVGGNESEDIEVKMTIDASKLPAWTLNGGSRGGTGPLLQTVEYDGYITLTSGSEVINVPWQVLPRRSATVRASDSSVKVGRSLRLDNRGFETGIAEQFALTGVSPRINSQLLPQPGDNFAIVDIRAVGARLAAPGIVQFGVNTFGTRAHPNYPAEFDISVDTNSDGTPEYVVFNSELGGFGVTGQNVVSVYNLATNTATAYFYTDADLQSGNIILTAPLTAMGLTDTSKFSFTVDAFDNYFTGSLTDEIGAMTFTPGTPKYAVSNGPSTIVPANGSASLAVTSVNGGATASPSQTGLLLLYRRQAAQREAEVVTIR